MSSFSPGADQVEAREMRPAVALAERVDGVDFAEIVRQPLGELIPGKAAQETLPVQRPEDLRRRGLDISPRSPDPR